MDNVKPEEIKKFSALAQDWWNIDGSMRMLHKMNPIRMHYIQKNTSLKEKKILDVGCGGGILSESLTKAYAEVTGIDLCASLIQIAQHHAQKKRLIIDYQHTSIETFSTEKAETFEVITCLELLEHVPDPQKIIDYCAKCLVPGGYIFFSTINRNLKSYLYAIVAAEYILNYLPKGTHDYKEFIVPSELNSWAENAGLLFQDIAGMTFQPTRNDFTLSKDVSVNYLTCYKKLT